MKRIISIFIASVVLAATLAGCALEVRTNPRTERGGENYVDPVMTDAPGYSGTPGY